VKIDRMELIHLRMPLVRPFETSFGRVWEKETILVRVESGGIPGWGESPVAAAPGYSYETVQTAWHILRDFLAPRLKDIEIARAGPIAEFFGFVRGHPMAKAGVEMAVLDLFARREGKPLSALLGGRVQEIPTGVSLGIEARVSELLDQVRHAVARGYRRIKIKIKPGWDVEAVERIRSRFGDFPLMVDANAAYKLDDGSHLAGLDPYDLMMIEQPLEYDDVMDHAVLQQAIHTPICLDESIHTVRIARDAIAAGACRIINIKPGRVGGHQQSIELHDLCAAHDIPVWHGGMLESGIGRAHNIHLASLPNFRLPGDIAASKRYYEPDLIEPAIDIAEDGTIAVPTGPGIGVKVLRDRVEKATERHLVVDAREVAR
jgi:O-succinylbenzoate synthase